MAALDDPGKQADLVTAVETRGSVKEAAQLVGLTRQTIGAYLRKHPELRADVDAAAYRYRVTAKHAPGMLATTSAPVTERAPGDLEPVPQVDRAEVLVELWKHAKDPNSRGCSKSLDFLAQLAFAPEILKMRAEAKRAELAADAGDRRPLVIRVPEQTTRPAQRQMIDAEVVG